MKFSIVVPTLNEEAALPKTLERLSRLRGDFEVIVADGGSADQTLMIAESFRDVTVLQCERGRGQQQAAGARLAKGDVLWFVHADSIPVEGALEAIESALDDSGAVAGNFTLRFDGDTRAARHLTIAYPWFRLFGLCYGDSGIFVRREVYDAVGGVQPFPLFEDVDFVKRVKRAGRFVRLSSTLTTSSRRFENRSIVKMFAHWTFLQALYWAGVSPAKLAALYAHIR